MTFQSFTFGSVVTFECDSGFALNGARKISCEADRSWTSAMPVCERITCFPPVVPQRGRIEIHDNMKYGSTIEFFCDEGYQLVGENISICQADGSWSGITPSCAHITCPPPDPSQNVIVSVNSHGYGSLAQYSCNTGYRLDGPATRTCTGTGSWSGDEPLCTRDECRRTRPLIHGTTIGVGSKPNDQIFFQCDRGYELKGFPFKICLDADLEWSNEDPTCEKKTCPAPPTLANGFYAGNSLFYQDTVEYGCDPGYHIVGQNTITCLAVGQWSRTDVACVKVSCGPPPIPAHSEYSLPSNEDDGKFNDTATLSCLEGYLARGVSYRRCQASGGWTQSNFTCEVVLCPSFKSIQNANIKSAGLAYGGIVEIECDQGYYLVGKASRKCGSDGNWEDEYEPYCEQIQCDELLDISNGKTLFTNRFVGSVVTFQCDEGYRRHGSDRRECQSDGQWSGSDPYCRLITCPVPPPVEHANQFDSLAEYLYKSEARYHCDKGYTISSGDTTLVCSANAQWEGTVPTCSVITCGEPDVLANGRFFIASYVYLSEIQYICLQGYRLKGSATVTCDETGNWAGEQRECVPIDCGEPPYVVNARNYDTGVHTFNTEVAYNCDVGFVLSGLSSVRCEANGVWSSPPPICEPISCGPPPTVDYATYTGVDFFYLDRVSYICADGYSLLGNDVLLCTYDGSWEGERPVCEELSCGHPPQLPFATTVLSGGTGVGTSATFQCSVGYYLVGSSTAMCLPDLKWKVEGNDPFCQPVDCFNPPKIVNGRPIFTSTTFDASVIFECDVGYRMSVEGELICGMGGNWKGTMGVCEAKGCGFPPLGDNLDFIGS